MSVKTLHFTGTDARRCLYTLRREYETKIDISGRRKNRRSMSLRRLSVRVLCMFRLALPLEPADAPH
jgi:hypothetical protein